MDYVEKTLGDSADKHSAEIQALKDLLINSNTIHNIMNYNNNNDNDNSNSNSNHITIITIITYPGPEWGMIGQGISGQILSQGRRQIWDVGGFDAGIPGKILNLGRGDNRLEALVELKFINSSFSSLSSY